MLVTMFTVTNKDFIESNFISINQFNSIQFNLVQFSSFQSRTMQNDVPAAAHRLRGHHLVDALLILLGQDGQLACLLVLERLEDDLVLGFGRHLRLVVPQCLVLLGLHLARVLELLLDLQLQHLQTAKKNGQAGGRGLFWGWWWSGGGGKQNHGKVAE